METPAGPGTAGVAPARVLIVDDDPTIRMLCAIYVRRGGHVVLEAEDGEGALAQARSEPPDIVLTDVRMPGCDGFELAEALRGDEATRGIPLIFVSGDSSVANRARADELGALAFLEKPFDSAALAVVIADAVALVHAAREERRAALS